jgi:hypothetical protein
MRFVGRGNSAIRATHTKTLELIADAEITERATCVIATGVAPQTRALAGRVRITISAGGESFGLEARANSSWDPSGPAVIRRSPLRLPGTLATHATAAASDLPPSLVDALRDPATTVEVAVELIPAPPCAVLFALDPHRSGDRRLPAELAAADLVVAEDDEAARLVGERAGHGPIRVDGRVLVLATRELPGQTVLDALRTVDIETVGLSPRLSAAAASPSRGPLLIAPGDADPRDLLRRTAAGTRLVLTTPADRLPALLQLADETRGPIGAVLVQEYAPPLRIESGSSPELPNRSPVHICFDAAGESTSLDPAVWAAIDGLLADGVATKAVAKALAALSGWDRRRAYEAIVARRSAKPGSPSI